MKIRNYKKYACFEYISNNDCNNPYNLGDIVIKTNTVDHEIGVVIQVHDDFELRTDMFGNECTDNLSLATREEIIKYRNEIYDNNIPY